MEEKNENFQLREETRALLVGVLHSSNGHPGDASLSATETRQLLKRLLKNAVTSSGHFELINFRQSAKPSEGNTKTVSALFENSHINFSVKQYLTLLDEIIHFIQFMVDAYKYQEDDPQLILIMVRESKIGSSLPFANRNAQMLYTVQTAFRNATDAIKVLKESADKTGYVSVAHVKNVLNQMRNCNRSLLRLFRVLHGHLANLDYRTVSQLCAWAQCAKNLLIQLLANSRDHILFVRANGNLLEKCVATALAKLDQCIVLFEVGIVKSLEEKRHLVSLISELELKKAVQTSSKQIKAPIQKSRLIYHRPDFKPKSFLLSLPLAKKRQQLFRQRLVQKSQRSIQPTLDQFSDMQRRLQRLEEHVKKTEADAGCSLQQKHRAAPKALDAVTKSTEKVEGHLPENVKHFEDNVKEVSLMQMVLSNLVKPKNISEKDWREIVEDAVEELTHKLMRLCDDIIDETFMNEIVELRR